MLVFHNGGVRIMCDACHCRAPINAGALDHWWVIRDPHRLNFDRHYCPRLLMHAEAGTQLAAQPDRITADYMLLLHAAAQTREGPEPQDALDQREPSHFA